MQQGLLPLFPLQVVLLPGGQLPLHIFEDRYKEMIEEALRDRQEFGVVLASDKGLVNQGCTATVDRVLKRYPDGRMDILTVGRRRFEILLLNEERSFLRGVVEFFDDEERQPPAGELTVQTIDSYNRLQKLALNPPLDPALAADPKLSFRLADVVTDLNVRQVLLGTRNEADRMKQLADYLPGYLERQTRMAQVKRLAPRNGHVHSSEVV